MLAFFQTGCGAVRPRPHLGRARSGTSSNTPDDDLTRRSAVAFHTMAPILTERRAPSRLRRVFNPSAGEISRPLPKPNSCRPTRTDTERRLVDMTFQSTNAWCKSRRSRSVGRGPPLRPFSKPLWTSVYTRVREPNVKYDP